MKGFFFSLCRGAKTEGGFYDFVRAKLFFLRLQKHKNQVVTVSEAEGEVGVKGRQFLGSFLSISPDSSQDAPGHQGTVSVCLYSNPSKVDQSPFFSTSSCSSSSFTLFFFILNGSRTDSVVLQKPTASLLMSRSDALWQTDTTKSFNEKESLTLFFFSCCRRYL